MTFKVLLALSVCVLITAPAVFSAGAVQPITGTLQTKDGVNISYDHYKQGSGSVIVVCPGFFNSKDNRWMKKAVQMLLTEYDVIIFDFRGHGKSAGIYTWSAKEHLDLDAVMDYAGSQHYEHIGILAFSLGAATAINEAAVRPDIDSMVLVSCPSKFQNIDYHFWEPAMFVDLKDNIESGWEGKGARFSNIFLQKQAPIDSVRSIKHAALFFIHGDNDWVIKARHSKKMYESAATKKRLEIIKGGYHAERLFQFQYNEMSDSILEWFSETLS